MNADDVERLLLEAASEPPPASLEERVLASGAPVRPRHGPYAIVAALGAAMLVVALLMRPPEPGGPAQDGPGPDPALVEKLGSADWREREAARRSLREAGGKARALLEAAARSDDVAVRSQARSVLDLLDRPETVLLEPVWPRREVPLEGGRTSASMRFVADLDWSADSALLAAAFQVEGPLRGGDGVRVWDAATWTEAAWFASGDRRASAVRFLKAAGERRRPLAFIRSMDNAWTIVDAAAPGAAPAEVVLDRGGRMRLSMTAKLALSPDGAHALTTGVDNAKILWDAGAWKELRTLEGPAPALPTEAAFSPDGRLVAGASRETSKVWSVPDGALVAEVRGSAPAWLGETLLTLDGEELLAWRAPWREPAGRRLRGRALALAAGGGCVAVGYVDGTTELLREGAPVSTHEHRGPNPPVSVLAFSPDGRRLAAGHYDGAVQVIEVKGGTK